MAYPIIIGAHGIGDSILAIQCASFCEGTVMLCVRDEVYKPILHAFQNDFLIYQHEEKEKWGENNWILSNQEEIKKYVGRNVYYVVPDLLFRNPFAFDYRKYNVSPQVIKSTRLLTHRWRPEKRIYVGLRSSHTDYQFRPINELLESLAINFPDYEIYYPYLAKWNGGEIPGAGLRIDLPSNVVIDTECDIKTTCEKLRTSDYGIFVDNGFSHLAYQFGVPRLVLDHYFQNPAFSARWRENEEDYIPFTENIKEIVSITFNSIKYPETLMLNKNWLKNANVDWAKTLLFKY